MLVAITSLVISLLLKVKRIVLLTTLLRGKMISLLLVMVMIMPLVALVMIILAAVMAMMSFLVARVMTLFQVMMAMTRSMVALVMIPFMGTPLRSMMKPKLLKPLALVTTPLMQVQVMTLFMAVMAMTIF